MLNFKFMLHCTSPAELDHFLYILSDLLLCNICHRVLLSNLFSQSQLLLLIMRTKSLVILSAAILTQLFYLFKGYILRQNKITLLDRIKSLKECSPKELISKLKLKDGTTQQFLCLGRLFAGEPCKAILNPTINVAHSRLYEGEFNSLSKQKNLLRVAEPSYLKLKGDQQIINIFEGHQATIMPTKIMRIKGLSFIQKMKKWMTSFFTRAKSKNQRLSLSQFYQCERVFELYLAEGSNCTVLGDFVKEGQQIVCNRPKLIFPDKKRMITFIQESVIRLNRINVLLGISFGICLLLLLKQAYAFIKRQRQGKNVAESPFNRLKKIFVKSRVCSICKKNLSCIYNNLCEHMVICQDCFPKSIEDCPQCNEKMANYTEMFVC